jgi:hypothetical protein
VPISEKYFCVFFSGKTRVCQNGSFVKVATMAETTCHFCKKCNKIHPKSLACKGLHLWQSEPLRSGTVLPCWQSPLGGLAQPFSLAETCRKSLCHKGLRQKTGAGFAVSPYAIRVYVKLYECILPRLFRYRVWSQANHGRYHSLGEYR